jgi:hypothetical protein
MRAIETRPTSARTQTTTSAQAIALPMGRSRIAQATPANGASAGAIHETDNGAPNPCPAPASSKAAKAADRPEASPIQAKIDHSLLVVLVVGVKSRDSGEAYQG